MDKASCLVLSNVRPAVPQEGTIHFCILLPGAGAVPRQARKQLCREGQPMQRVTRGMTWAPSQQG